jgi:ferritin-like metal-binding protein YciE
MKSKNKIGTSVSIPNIEDSLLLKFFEDELMSIYWIEKTLASVLPKMATNVSAKELKAFIENYIQRNHEEIHRIELIFHVLKKNPISKKCETIAAMNKTVDYIFKKYEKGAIQDVEILSLSQNINDYKIASYEKLKKIAQALGIKDILTFLDGVIEEQKCADQRLIEIANKNALRHLN